MIRLLAADPRLVAVYACDGVVGRVPLPDHRRPVQVGPCLFRLGVQSLDRNRILPTIEIFDRIGLFLALFSAIGESHSSFPSFIVDLSPNPGPSRLQPVSTKRPSRQLFCAIALRSPIAVQRNGEMFLSK